MSFRRTMGGTAVLLLSFAFWYSPIGVAHADAGSDESAFIAKINGLRASKGLSRLSYEGQLTGVARNWASKMAAAGKISHNPNLGSQVTSDWVMLGENVGVGGDVNALFSAFVASPTHYANLINPKWTHLGVGVIHSGGTMYTTHNFEQMRGASSAPTPTTTKPKTSPAPSKPKSSSAPKTTTTQASPPPPASVAPVAPVEPPRMPERTMHSLDELYDLLG